METNSLASLLYGHNRPVVQPTAQPQGSGAFNAPANVGQSEAYRRHVQQAQQAGQQPMTPEAFMQSLRG